MNIPEDKIVKDWLHPLGLVDVSGMNLKALEFYGADIIDHKSWVDGKEQEPKKCLKNGN